MTAQPFGDVETLIERILKKKKGVRSAAKMHNSNQSEDDYFQSEVLREKYFQKKQGIKTISKYPDVFV